jgi:hypothetical protein
MLHETALEVIVETLSGQSDDLDAYLEAMQVLIDDGTAWKIEGTFGRNAMSLIEMGHLTLGPVGFHDAYGNYIPSRYEVKPGTKGSVEWAETQGGWLTEINGEQDERMLDAYEPEDDTGDPKKLDPDETDDPAGEELVR